MSNESPSRSFFRNAYDAFIAVRQRQANHYVERLNRIYSRDLCNPDSKR